MVKKILYLLISFIVFVLLLTVGQWFIKPASYSDVVVLDEGWTVYYNGTKYYDVKLSELRNIVSA